MRRACRFARVVGLGCGLLLVVPAPSAAGAATPPPPLKRSALRPVLADAGDGRTSRAPARPLTVLLLADKKDHGPGEHDYPRWQSRWALLLGGAAASSEKAANLCGPDIVDPAAAQGAEHVRVVTAQEWPPAGQWTQADLIVAFCYLAWTEPRLKQVRAFLDRGGGLVLIHSATWTKPQPSPAVAELTGVGGFQRWRHGAMSLTIRQLEHPICRGLPPTVPLEDESYWPPTPAITADRVEVLAVGAEPADAGGGTTEQPMLWTFERGTGRVFGCVPGHYNWTFDQPYFRLLLLRGMAWAAHDEPRRFDALVLRGASLAD